MDISSPNTSLKGEGLAMIAEDILDLIDDRPDDGVFRVHRRVFTDPALFDLEMRILFEGGWVFLGLASQAPRSNDYFTTTVGRHPVVVMRAGDGALNAFVNSCPHKGARICQLEHGHAKLHVCPYHSWSFDSAGRNRAIKGKTAGGYAGAFDGDSHDLKALGAFGEYRGLLFGLSLIHI